VERDRLRVTEAELAAVDKYEEMHRYKRDGRDARSEQTRLGVATRRYFADGLMNPTSARRSKSIGAHMRFAHRMTPFSFFFVADDCGAGESRCKGYLRTRMISVNVTCD